MSAWTAADAVRVMRQVHHLHNLGPRPLLEFLTELAVDLIVRDDIEHLLVRYGRLDPALVVALDAHDLRLPIVVIEGGEIREASA